MHSLIEKNKSFLKIFLLVLLIFSKEIFFVTYDLLGKAYEGSESSNAFIILNVITFLILTMYIIRYAFIKNISNKKTIALIAINIIFISVFLIEYVTQTHKGDMYYRFQQFILWASPMMFLGSIFAIERSHENINNLIKSLFIVAVFMSLSSFSILYKVIVLQGKVVLGGAGRLKAGYTLALVFAIFVSKLLKESKRQILLNIYSIIIYIAILSTGARGASLVATIILSYYIIRKITLKNFIYIVVIGSFLFLIINNLSTREMFKFNLNRTFEYIGDDGINWSGSSGRDKVYSTTIDHIKNKPIIGYGIFSYSAKLGYKSYPHNIFLEFLIQGGIIYFLVASIIIVRLFRKTHYLKEEKDLVFILYIYQLINLIFSGTYMATGLFWMIMSYLYFVETNKPSSVLKL